MISSTHFLISLLCILMMFTIVYIDDVLIFSKSIKEHWKHLNAFLATIKHNGLVVSTSKIKLFQTKIRFLGFDIFEGKIRPIDRVIQFADKFPDVITEKTQLQRFLGSLNYIADFYKDLRKYCKPLFDRLRSNPSPWTDEHTTIVKQIKIHVKTLSCLGIPSDHAFKIVETDASEIGFGSILKQRVSPGSSEQIVHFHSGSWILVLVFLPNLFANSIAEIREAGATLDFDVKTRA
jgi:hypothetical protein